MHISQAEHAGSNLARSGARGLAETLYPPWDFFLNICLHKTQEDTILFYHGSKGSVELGGLNFSDLGCRLLGGS